MYSFSCYEVSLHGCVLQDLLVSFSRPPGSREEKGFICRLGEIQVSMWELWGEGRGIWGRVWAPGEEGVDGG